MATRNDWNIRIRRGGAYDDVTLRSTAGTIIYNDVSKMPWQARRELRFQIRTFVRKLFRAADMLKTVAEGEAHENI